MSKYTIDLTLDRKAELSVNRVKGTHEGLSHYSVESRLTGKDLQASWLGGVRPYQMLGYVIGTKGEWRFLKAYEQMGELRKARSKKARRSVLVRYPTYATVREAAEAGARSRLLSPRDRLNAIVVALIKDAYPTLFTMSRRASGLKDDAGNVIYLNSDGIVWETVEWLNYGTFEAIQDLAIENDIDLDIDFTSGYELFVGEPVPPMFVGEPTVSKTGRTGR